MAVWCVMSHVYCHVIYHNYLPKIYTCLQVIVRVKYAKYSIYIYILAVFAARGCILELLLKVLECF